MTFRIYYSDGSIISGVSKKDWLAAPDNNVQVVVDLDFVGSSGWTYTIGKQNIVVKDRQLWTGEDEYDPFEFGVKTGSLIGTTAYFNIWNRACADN